ncbi:hypothetical protein M0R45_034221 [Rubus argutus]|uniref:Uncharacterized protein n=1 Tax=Rubus argutus TaxID=59490 RepID=A0AAW1VTN8_RUBAR
MASVPTTSLPLTFFDIVFLFCGPVELIYLYECAHPLHYFIKTILPKLKHSLSITLQHFFPLASYLICPPPPSKRTLFCLLRVSPHLTPLDHCRVLKQLQPPNIPPRKQCSTIPLPYSAIATLTCVVTPVALQITMFPYSGICIGVNFLHALIDGSALHHFMKSWASVCRSQDVKTLSLPSHNRVLIKDPCSLENEFLAAWRTWTPIPWELHMNPFHPSLTVKVRTTFVLSRPKIDRLKHCVSSLYRLWLYAL